MSWGRKKAPTFSQSESGQATWPVGSVNGYLTANPSIHAPTTTTDHSVRDFRRFVNVGQYDVQLRNGLRNGQGLGRMQVPGMIQSYLATSMPTIPGQRRDNWGGFHKRGIDPLSYAKLVSDGPGSQPQNPGGPGKIAAPTFYNPGTT
jgi:hypothetical protein